MEQWYGNVNLRDVYREISPSLIRKKKKEIKYIPKKKLNENESLELILNSGFGYAMTQKELYYTYRKGLGLNDTQISQLNIDPDKEIEEFFGDILADAVFIMMQDIILYNRTISLAGIGAYTEVHMRVIKGDEFIKERQRGNYQYIDYLESNFKAYCPCFYYYRKAGGTPIRQTDVSMDDRFQQDLAKQVNSGKEYYPKAPVLLMDYVEKVSLLYPNIKIQTLYQIIRFGVRQISINAKSFMDIFISKGGRYIYIGNVIAFCGKKPEKYYARQLRKRIRKLWYSKNIKWDGYYYFGISKPEFKKYFKPDGSLRYKQQKKFYFNKCKLLCKSPEIASLLYRIHRYIVRVKSSDVGFFRFIRTYIDLYNVEFYKFQPNLKISDLCNTNYSTICQKKKRLMDLVRG